MDIGRLFPSPLPSGHRRFLIAALAHLRDRTLRRVVIPAAGDFTVVKAAIAAGFPKSDILATDSRFFPALLGHYYAGNTAESGRVKVESNSGPFYLPLSGPRFIIHPGPLSDAYTACATDTDRLALLLLHLKLSQFRQDRDFEVRYMNDLLANAAPHLARIGQALETFREFYAGISFQVEDLRRVSLHADPSSVIVFFPPSSAMGKVPESIGYRSDTAPWSASKEYRTFYDTLKALPSPCLVYRSKDTDGFDPAEVAFAREAGHNRYDYWLSTKPEALTPCAPARLSLRPRRHPQPYRNLRIFSEADAITPESTVRFQSVREEHALYYRDLFAHRLGDARAELYALCIVDNKIFAVAGFHGQKLRIGQENHVAENFGFSIRSPRYPDANRLLMLFITCEQFARFLDGAMPRKNRTYDMHGLKTTCLSKYRKVKLNNGILPVISREKLTTGPFADMYRIVYQVDWYKRTYADCITLYLSEINKKNGGKS